MNNLLRYYVKNFSYFINIYRIPTMSLGTVVGSWDLYKDSLTPKNLHDIHSIIIPVNPHSNPVRWKWNIIKVSNLLTVIKLPSSRTTTKKISPFSGSMALCYLKPLASLLIPGVQNPQLLQDQGNPSLPLRRHSEGWWKESQKPGVALSMKCPLAASTPLVAKGLARPVHPWPSAPSEGS